MSASTGETELDQKASPNTMVRQHKLLSDPLGEVDEWVMALVLRTNRD